MGYGYSEDLREKILTAYDRHEVRMEELAERFDVSVSFIKNLVRQRRETGSIAAKPPAGGVAPSLGPEHLAMLEAEIDKTPDATRGGACRAPCRLGRSACLASDDRPSGQEARPHA